MKLFVTLFALVVLTSSAALAQDEWKILLDTREIVELVADGDVVWAATASSGIVKIDTKTKARTFYQQHNSGLVENRVLGLAKSGNTLWIASYAGLSSFDGTTWQHFTSDNSGLPDNVCTDVAIDRQNNIWVGTWGGVARFDGASNWQPHATGLPANQFLKLALDSTGGVYAMASKRVARFAGSAWSLLPQDFLLAPAENQFSIEEQFESIAVDKNSNVYVGTSRLAIHKCVGSQWQRIEMNYGSDQFGIYLYSPVRALAIAPNGDVWAGNTFALVHFKTDTVVGVFKQSSITLSLDIRNDQSVWLGGEGVVRYDLTTFEDFPTAEAMIPANQIREVVADDFGRVWLTAMNGPVSRFDGSQWTRVSLPRGAFSVLPLSIDTTWFAYGTNGAGMFAGDTYTDHFAIQDTELYYNAFRAFEDNHGDAWINKRFQLLQHLDDTVIIHSIPDASITYNGNAFRFDKQHTLWIGSTYFGLASFDGADWKYSNDGDFEFASETVYDLNFDSKGLMWCVTSDGLLSFDGTTTTLYPRSGIGDNMGKSSLIIENDSSFWIGAQDGLWHFDTKQWKQFSKANSPLPDDRIGDIAMDKAGNIWIGTSNSGVAIFRPGGINMSTGADVAEEQCAFVVIPNPATNTIRLNASYDAQTYTLIDQLGRFIRNDKLPTNYVVDVHDLPNGSYTILIEMRDGTQCQARFIIDR